MDPVLAPEPGADAAAMFGDGLPLAERYAALLAGDGVAHGHVGPREVDRLWSRHLLNCAVVTELLPTDAVVVDVGSGAGLPGLPMAIRRPDLRVTLVEPMQRRVDFLERCARELELESRVRVVRGRADDAATVSEVGSVQWVTARAVAPLDRLVRWCLPLLSADGRLLAMKGRRAQDEIDRLEPALRRAGVVAGPVTELSAGDELTRVVIVTRRDRTRGTRPTRRGGR